MSTRHELKIELLDIRARLDRYGQLDRSPDTSYVNGQAMSDAIDRMSDILGEMFNPVSSKAKSAKKVRGRTLTQAKAYVGGLSKPSKMPGWSYGLPAANCRIGSKLAAEPDTVCSGCYALKGNYQWPSVALSQQRKLAAIRLPDWVDCMVQLIAHYSPDVFRWHDSGDIQDSAHLDNIVEVARRLPDTKFWIPTREVNLVRVWLQENGQFPGNLCVRLSAVMVDTKPPRYSLPVVLPTSTVHSQHGPGAPTGKGNITCRAPERDGTCSKCRACWSPKVANVSYGAH